MQMACDKAVQFATKLVGAIGGERSQKGIFTEWGGWIIAVDRCRRRKHYPNRVLGIGLPRGVKNSDRAGEVCTMCAEPI